ncbi:universal stress protein [Halorussus lipolyticus]|uniref:universal stress protein n=1 Tax=Halorussus lipolyticus TaxID=3034024 RepID=UPI0023E7ED6A|nr:universal stress protein [Halorussus sp. DT80]
MYDSILVPIDGSQQADNALDHALGLADTYDAEIHLLFVVSVASVPNEIDAGPVEDKLDRYGEGVTSSAAERAGEAGVEARTEVVPGTPHRAILDYAGDREVDLVVMGTHGRTGIDRYLLGSVTEKVVRLADAPVLTVHAEDDSEPGA